MMPPNPRQHPFIKLLAILRKLRMGPSVSRSGLLVSSEVLKWRLYGQDSSTVPPREVLKPLTPSTTPRHSDFIELGWDLGPRKFYSIIRVGLVGTGAKPWLLRLGLCWTPLGEFTDTCGGHYFLTLKTSVAATTLKSCLPLASSTSTAWVNILITLSCQKGQIYHQ